MRSHLHHLAAEAASRWPDSPALTYKQKCAHVDGLQQLDFEGALLADLPIGSGEIESGHRYIVQKRMKLPGAWWEAANADHMPALRVNLANGGWVSYWAWATDYRHAA